MGFSCLWKQFWTPPLGRTHQVYKAFQLSTQLRFW